MPKSRNPEPRQHDPRVQKTEHALEIDADTASLINSTTDQWQYGLITKDEMARKVAYLVANYVMIHEPVLIAIVTTKGG